MARRHPQLHTIDTGKDFDSVRFSSDYYNKVNARTKTKGGIPFPALCPYFLLNSLRKSPLEKFTEAMNKAALDDARGAFLDEALASARILVRSIPDISSNHLKKR